MEMRMRMEMQLGVPDKAQMLSKVETKYVLRLTDVEKVIEEHWMSKTMLE